GRYAVGSTLPPGLLMLRLRLLLASLLALVAVTAAACGGGGGGGKSSGALPGGASVVPASAPVFISINSDFSSDQWSKATTLAKRFPGLPDLLANLEGQLKQENVSFERDVKPALGPEVDVVFL